ncbi:MAG: hypothetical protein HQ582_29950 [Planctomycetes bacterium]|nr:hypothetical protein [Planctomycetota bacterium]
MNCGQSQGLFDNLLVAEPEEALHAEWVEHLGGCSRCRDEQALADEALASIRPSRTLRASPGFSDRVMNAIDESDVVVAELVAAPHSRTSTRKWALAAAAAVVLAVAIPFVFRSDPDGSGPVALSDFTLLSQACAAEGAFFVGEGVLHIVNEIVVEPVSNPILAQIRWFPIVSLEASGGSRFHQLTLAAGAGEGYTVEDHAWYDRANGRFVRILTVDDRPIYANSYDGKAVFFLEPASEGQSRIQRHEIGDDFHAPKSPAELLGIAAGLPSRLDETKRDDFILGASDIVLPDGSEGRVLKIGFPQEGGPKGQPEAENLITIRKDDRTIAKMEFKVDGKSLYVVRRVKTETVAKPVVPFDLTGFENRIAKTSEKPPAGIVGDMVIPDVSIAHMVEKAGFETYIFSPDPPWTEKREIVDILDIPSPPNRAFATAYRASDGRHVVLWQAQSNTLVAGVMTKVGKVIHTSPSGTKLWRVPMHKWLANIALQSARATIKDAPSDDRTGYLLETPAGTYATLAINGKATDQELHALVDSLTPAKECLEEEEPQGSDKK